MGLERSEHKNYVDSVQTAGQVKRIMRLIRGANREIYCFGHGSFRKILQIRHY